MKKIDFHSIRFKVSCATLLIAVLLLFAVESFMVRSIRSTVEQSMISRMESDIRYIEDLIGNEVWHAENGVLYCGETAIGDGTEQNAYLAPFLALEQKTGSFSYTFIRCPDDGLTWVGDKARGYRQGHYLRVSGSTLTSDGKKIIGTYMDKKVADVLDTEGVYTGFANVTGETVFCLYHTLENASGDTVGVIVVGRSVEEIEALTDKSVRILFWVVAGLVLLAAALLRHFVARWVTKLDIVNRYLQSISTGVLPSEPLELRSGDELDVTARCINEMTASLREKARITGELETAAGIQAHMLPRTFPAFPDQDEFDIFAVMHPAKEVGGDFYDFFMTDSRHLAVVIADVSGKGVPAALVMAIIKMLIKNHTRTGLAPKDVFSTVNALLCEGNEDSVFITAWMGILDLDTGKLTYVNAGHLPPLISKAGGGFVPLKAPPGVPLAAFDSFRYQQQEYLMDPGDRLFLYTDGVTEAADSADSLYGARRLTDYLNAAARDSAETILHGLKNDIDRFSASREQFDDITMLMLDYLKRENADRGSDMTERAYPASVDRLQDVLDFLDQTFEESGVPNAVAVNMNIIAEELFTNIALYAYPGGEGDVRVALKVRDGVITLRFTDRGIPFDPLQAQMPDLTLPAEERPIGGLGIFMVKKTADDVRYARENGQNILTVTKRCSVS